MARFFRTASDAIYEQARAALDLAWGLPDDKGTVTCIEPAATAPRDSQGRIVLAVNDEFCEYSVANEMLPQLLASGAVEEITEAEYRAAIQAPDPLQG
jgi:hypothetical protein